MANDTAVLRVALEAQTAAFERGMADAAKSMERLERNTETVAQKFTGFQGSIFSFNQTMQAFNSGMALIGTTLNKLKGITAARESMQALEGSLKSIIGPGAETADMLERTVELTTELGIPLESAASNVRRMAIGMKGLGSSNAEIAKVTSTFLKLGAIGGSMREAETALFQFSQAMSSGSLRGDEMITILERVPAVADAIAKHLGKDIGELRKLGAEGKITSQDLSASMMDALGNIDAAYKNLPRTMEQSLNIISTQFKLMNIAINESLQINESVGAALGTFVDLLIGWRKNVQSFFKDLEEGSVAAQIAFAAAATSMAVMAGSVLIPTILKIRTALIAMNLAIPGVGLVTALSAAIGAVILIIIANWEDVVRISEDGLEKVKLIGQKLLATAAYIKNILKNAFSSDGRDQAVLEYRRQLLQLDEDYKNSSEERKKQLEEQLARTQAQAGALQNLGEKQKAANDAAAGFKPPKGMEAFNAELTKGIGNLNELPKKIELVKARLATITDKGSAEAKYLTQKLAELEGAMAGKGKGAGKGAGQNDSWSQYLKSLDNIGVELDTLPKKIAEVEKRMQGVGKTTLLWKKLDEELQRLKASASNDPLYGFTNGLENARKEAALLPAKIAILKKELERTDLSIVDREKITADLKSLENSTLTSAQKIKAGWKAEIEGVGTNFTKMKEQLAYFEEQFKTSTDPAVVVFLTASIKRLKESIEEANGAKLTGFDETLRTAGDEVEVLRKNLKLATEQLSIAADPDRARALQAIIKDIEQQLTNKDPAKAMRQGLIQSYGSAKDLSGKLKEVQELADAGYGPAKDLYEKLKAVRELTDDGIFSPTMARQAIQDLTGIKDPILAIKDEIEKTAFAFTDRLVDNIRAGKFEFRDLVADMLAQMAKLLLSHQMKKFLNIGTDFLGNLLGGRGGGGGFGGNIVFDGKVVSGGGGGGGLSGILSGLLGSLFSAKGNAFGSGIGLPYGVYDRPTYFNVPGSGPLRRFAQGGVLGEAGPEAIMPLKRGTDGRLGVEGGGVNVNVYNNASGVSARVEQDGNDISVIIEQVRKQLTNDIKSGGNMFANSLAGTYGLNRINR